MALDGEQLEGEGKGGNRGINTACLLPVVLEAPQHCLAYTFSAFSLPRASVFMKPFMELSWLQCRLWASTAGPAHAAVSHICKGPVP